jgi:Fe2+ transport system protein B
VTALSPLRGPPAADAASNRAADRPSIVVVGKESVGKSQWIASFTGRPAMVGNFRGTTVACEIFDTETHRFVDTPGIVRSSDAATTRLALDAVGSGDAVLVVVQATHLDDDLSEILPLAAGVPGAVIVTFWDKVDGGAARTLAQLSEQTGVAFIPLDARRLTEHDRHRIAAALADLHPLPATTPLRFGRRIEPRPGLFESRFGGAIALLVLIAPAVLAVEGANRLASLVDPFLQESLHSPIERIGRLTAGSEFLRTLFVGDYGLLTMGPLLLVWAVPTVVLFALLLAAYKASGLVDRLNAALHPWVRPLGLAGRDVVRIVMGFGCNVPAVVSTRSCSSCSRGACISAVAFGSACSYQLPATAAVFAAAGRPELMPVFLGYLLATTAVYLRWIATPEARSKMNLLLVERRTFLQLPSLAASAREARVVLGHFFVRALPVFCLITLVASVAAYWGVVDAAAQVTASLMKVFRMPAESALPIVMASVRKDGILLFLNRDGLRTPLSAGQLLTGTYLAGVLFPCLVTLLTISREQSKAFALRLLFRQAAAASLFAVILGWGAALMGF